MTTNKTILSLFLLYLIGCNSNIDPSNKKQIEDTKYEIINSVLTPHLEFQINELKKSENYPFDFERQVFEITVPIEYYTYGAYDNLIPKYYHIKKQDSLYPIKKWNKNKLENYKMIDTVTYNKFKKLNNKQNIETFLSKWEDEIGYQYLNIANPIFNSDFSKCLIYVYYTDSDWACGTGSNRLYEFKREGDKWYFSKDLLDITK